MTVADVTEAKDPPWNALQKSSVIGTRLLYLADWIAESNLVDGKGWSAEEAAPNLLLPSIQRSAVWRPRQVLDFWDSILRGLPVGAFYIMPGDDGQKGRSIRASATSLHGGAPVHQADRPGQNNFFLLDGQQRMRALLAGLLENNVEKRCVWIDLGAISSSWPSQVGAPFLFLTSEAQPFGYDHKTGTKLPLAARRAAEHRFSRQADNQSYQLIMKQGETCRPAYNQDLFAGEIYVKDESEQPTLTRLSTPPLPDGSSAASTVQLWKLYQEWYRDPVHVLANLKDQSERGFQIDLVQQVNVAHWLNTVFEKLTKAEVALIKVELPCERDDRKRSISTLFTRIGSGGTALTAGERLYSIYKHYVPDAYDFVEGVRDKIGNILPAVEIAGTALRIANVKVGMNVTDNSHYSNRLGTPSEEEFIEQISKEQSSIRDELSKLIQQDLSKRDTLAQAFRFLLGAVRGSAGVAPGYPASPFWIPDVLLASLPIELWQVLVFWAVQNADSHDSVESRYEIVRFVLFWLLCVENDEKAGYRLFEKIAVSGNGQKIFPGKAFYLHLIEDESDKPYVLELVRSSEMATFLTHDVTSDLWPSWKTRFETSSDSKNPKERNLSRLAARWWPRHGGGQRLLPWLQREYIKKNFNDYFPLGQQEDDLPYDIDHIFPSNSWGARWNSRQSSFTELSPDELAAMQHNRHTLGDSIGNLQLLDASENRRAKDRSEGKDFTLPDSSNPYWQKMQDDVAVWDAEKRRTFRGAVEYRGAWLYEAFFEPLEYCRWVSANDAASPKEVT